MGISRLMSTSRAGHWLAETTVGQPVAGARDEALARFDELALVALSVPEVCGRHAGLPRVGSAAVPRRTGEGREGRRRKTMARRFRPAPPVEGARTQRCRLWCRTMAVRLRGRLRRGRSAQAAGASGATARGKAAACGGAPTAGAWAPGVRSAFEGLSAMLVVGGTGAGDGAASLVSVLGSASEGGAVDTTAGGHRPVHGARRTPRLLATSTPAAANHKGARLDPRPVTGAR